MCNTQKCDGKLLGVGCLTRELGGKLEVGGGRKEELGGGQSGEEGGEKGED